jgi:hypothetical protein
MKTKNLALGGAAIIALAGLMSFMPAPLFAQTAPDQTPPPGTSSQDNGLYGSQVNPPQVSSPAEKQETRKLNSQAVDGTTQSPAVLNGEAPATNTQTPPADPQSSNMPPHNQSAQNDAAQQQYQEQQQQYQQQQQQYQDKQVQYDEQKRQYDHNVRHYDEARWAYTDYPTAYAYRYDDSPHLRRLYLIADPGQQLANAPVEGPSGNWVGRIRNIETGFDGRPTRVQIALNHRVFVWVGADNLRFDAEDHVVFTRLTRDDLWNSPDAAVEPGGPY